VRVNELAYSVKLEPRHLDARPTGLSGGQKQRASIARAFAGTPSLVLCDEPVSALDVSVQAAILNLLVDLQKTGVSYVFISHDLAVVRYISDWIGVMYLGWLVEVGPADAVFDVPHHPYTESLLSSVPALGPANGAHARIKLRGAMPSPSNPRRDAVSTLAARFIWETSAAIRSRPGTRAGRQPVSLSHPAGGFAPRNYGYEMARTNPPAPSPLASRRVHEPIWREKADRLVRFTAGEVGSNVADDRGKLEPVAGEAAQHGKLGHARRRANQEVVVGRVGVHADLRLHRLGGDTMQKELNALLHLHDVVPRDSGV
jgi:hypothetical protein